MKQRQAAFQRFLRGLLSFSVLFCLLATASTLPSPAAAQPRVAIYTTNWCGYCKMLRRHLDAEGIAYTEYNISSSESARERFEEFGGRGVPVVFVGSRRVDGYNPDLIDQLVREMGDD